MAQAIGSSTTQPAQRSLALQLRVALPLAAIIGLGTFLRLYQLEANGLWVDEIFTALFAAPGRSWLEVAQGPLNTPLPTPPLWFWISHIFLLLFGTGDVIVRLPAVLFGVGGMLLLFLTARTLFADHRIALVATLLLALSPVHIHYSREARFYPAIVFFSLLTILCLYQGTTLPAQTGKRAWGWWLAFAVASLLNIYTHLTALLVLAAGLLYAALALASDERRRPRATLLARAQRRDSFALPFLAALATIGLAYLPMFGYLLAGAGNPARGLGAAEETRGFELSLHYFFELFATFGAGGGFAFTLFTATALWGAWQGWSRYRRSLALFVSVLVVPFLLIALARPKHWFSFKYVISLLPIFLMLVSLGVVQLADLVAEVVRHSVQSKAAAGTETGGLRFLPVLFVLPFLVLSWPRALAEAGQVQPNRWRNISQLLENAGPEDAVAVLDLWDRILPAAQIMSYYGPTAAEANVRSITDAAQLPPLFERYERLWVVADLAVEVEAHPALARWLGTQPHVLLDMEHNAAVYLLRKNVTAAALLTEAESFTPGPAALASIGNAYLVQGLPVEGERLYLEAIRQAPQNASLYFGLGNLYLAWEKLPEAISVYQQALRLSPAAEFHAGLAQAYALAGNGPLAAEHYTMAIDLLQQQANGEGEERAALQTWQQALEQLQKNG